MTPIASRNVANILIIVGILPVVLWLFVVAFALVHRGDLLPWTSAGIIMFGVPLGMFSFFVAVPVMLFARKRAAENSTVWTRVHLVPFFFGVVTFLVALIVGIWLVVSNVRH